MEKVLNVWPGATVTAAAVVALESRPPLRKMPTGTSLTRRFFTEGQSDSQSVSDHPASLLGRGSPTGEGRSPVRPTPALAPGGGEERTGRRLLGPGQVGGGPGPVAVAEVAGPAAQVEVAADLGVREQRAQLGAEDDPAVSLRIVEGLLPHPVPSREQRLALGVPDHERKHAVELRQTVLAELFPGVDDHLRVGAGRESMAPRAELLRQAAVVVDLAVEDGMNRALLVGNRLTPGGEIDDLQTPVAERHLSVDVISFVVGAAMTQRRRHPPDDGRIGPPMVGRDEAAKPAHADFRASRRARCA